MWLIDDIYMMEGESLSNHIVPPDWKERWADWTDDEADNWIDTGGDFLGWIYVGEDGWIAPQKLGKWIYLPEKWVARCFQPGGAMGYIPRK